MKTFIFDLYGTIVDIKTDESSPQFKEAALEIFAKRGARITQEEIFDLWRKGFEKRRKEPTAEPDAYEVFKDIFIAGGVTPTKKLIKDAAWEWRKASTLHLKLYPEMAGVLSTLKRKSAAIYLLSNAQALFTKPELKLLDVEKYFDGIVISSDVGYNKPDERIFDFCLDKYGLNKKDCVFVGNDVCADVEGALSAGLTPVYIRTIQSSPDDGQVPTPYAVFDGDFDKLKEILLNLAN